MKTTFTKDTLFMKYPSTWWHDLWREGLVSGNGKVGANIYGGVKDETVMVTHYKLWHNGQEKELPDVSDAFRHQRELMDKEQFKEASWEVVNALRERNYEAKLQSPFPAADLKIQIKPIGGFTDYVRGIRMDSGETFSCWKEGTTTRTSELFVSRAQDVIVKRITSETSTLSASFSLDAHINTGSDRLEKYGRHILDSKEFHVEPPYMYYTAVNDDGKRYGVCGKVYCTDGTITQAHDSLLVNDAKEILVLLKVFVEEAVNEKENICKKLLGELDKLPCHYEALLKEHRPLHESYYRSADFSLGYEGEYHSNEELLLHSYSGTQSAELIEKLWRYGRYLFICGSTEDSDPFPLYGLWCGDYQLDWPHHMANENIQMIYWHTYAGNLLPFQKAFYQYYYDRIPSFKENAKKLFGMRGIYMTAGTTPAISSPNQVVPVIMNWVGAAGWIAQHYCQYYRYTEDKLYFKQIILPYLLEVADFYEDFVTYYPDGSIHFYPSVSPENTPGNFMPPKHIQMAHPMPTTINSTIDLAILKEFFTEMCHIAEEETSLTDRVDTWKKILASIPEYGINDLGGIKEWQDDRFDERHDHRHLSHIYPVFPGKEVNVLYKKELLPAFEKAVDLREIDAQTGWSMAHMSAIYARLEKGEAAMDCLNKMVRSCLTNNFFSLHNDWRGMNISLDMEAAPVQLDAIMGYVNAIQEMLLYSSDDLLKLLPALPDCMDKGTIRDFRYQNGIIHMSWNSKTSAFDATIQALRPHTLWLQLPSFVKKYNIQETNCSFIPSEGLTKLVMEENGMLTLSCPSR